MRHPTARCEECDSPVEYRWGAWICPTHNDRGHVVFSPKQRPLSTPSDIDARFGTRRRLEDSYVLHAYSIDQIRIMADRQIEFYCDCLNLAGRLADYWAEQLWQIDRALRELGIES